MRVPSPEKSCLSGLVRRFVPRSYGVVFAFMEILCYMSGVLGSRVLWGGGHLEKMLSNEKYQRLNNREPFAFRMTPSSAALAIQLGVVHTVWASSAQKQMGVQPYLAVQLQ